MFQPSVRHASKHCDCPQAHRFLCRRASGTACFPSRMGIGTLFPNESLPSSAQGRQRRWDTGGQTCATPGSAICLFLPKRAEHLEQMERVRPAMFLMFWMFRSLWERVTANVRNQTVHRPAAMAHLGWKAVILKLTAGCLAPHPSPLLAAGDPSVFASQVGFGLKLFGNPPDRAYDVGVGRC